MKTLVLAAVLLGLASPAVSTISSPSSVSVDSGNNFFEGYSGDVIIFEWTADSFDSGVVTIEPEDVNGDLEGEITDTVKLEVVSKQSSAEFSIRDGGRGKLQKIEYLTNNWQWKDWDLPSKSSRASTYETWALNNCDDVDGDSQISWYVREYQSGVVNEQLNGELACAAFSSDSVADVGEIESTPTETMSATFKLTVDGREYTETVTNSYSGSSDDKKTATFSDLAKINLQGGLESGYNFPQPDDELVVFSNSFDPNIRIIKDTAFENDYQDTLDDADTSSNLKDILLDTETWDHDKSYYENLYNSDIETYAVKYEESEFYEETNLEISGSSLSDGKIVVESEDKVGSYPSAQVVLKADEVGYFIPDATPVLESVSAPEVIEEGSTGDIEVTVRNIGSGQSDFTARVTSCSDGFTGGGSTVDFDLDAGEKATKTLEVSFNSGSYTSSEITGSCTVEVNNNRDTTETVTQETSLTGKQSTECDPDTYSKEYADVDGDGENEAKIFYCDPEGLTKSQVKVCDGDEVADKQSDGSYKCTTDPDPQEEICGNGVDDDGDGETDENCPGSLWEKIVDFLTPETGGGILGQLHLGLSIVVGLIAGFVGYKSSRWVDGEKQARGGFNPFKNRRERVEKGRIFVGVIGAVIGFLSGYFVAISLPLFVHIVVLIGASAAKWYLG